MAGSKPDTRWSTGSPRRLRSRRRAPRIDRTPNPRGKRFWRIAPHEPAKPRCLTDRLEAQRIEQMRDCANVTRRPLHAHDIGLLPRLRCHQRRQQRAAVARAALAEFQTSQPELVAALERAEQTESDRRKAAMAAVGPIDVAGHGDGFDSAGTRVQLDEIAGHKRALELVEEVDGFVALGGELAVEAAFCSPVAN